MPNPLRNLAVTGLLAAGIVMAAPTGVRAQSMDLPLENATAGTEDDCPNDTDQFWHFVIAPNPGAYAFESIRLSVGGESFTFSQSGGDNVFVEVPSGFDVSDLTTSGSSASVTSTSTDVGRDDPQFQLSHVCEGSTPDSTNGSTTDSTTDSANDDASDGSGQPTDEDSSARGSNGGGATDDDSSSPDDSSASQPSSSGSGGVADRDDGDDSTDDGGVAGTGGDADTDASTAADDDDRQLADTGPGSATTMSLLALALCGVGIIALRVSRRPIVS